MISSGVNFKYVRESEIGICGLKWDKAVVRRSGRGFLFNWNTVCMTSGIGSVVVESVAMPPSTVWTVMSSGSQVIFRRVNNVLPYFTLCNICHFRFYCNSFYILFRPCNLKIFDFEPLWILTTQNRRYDRGKPKFDQINKGVNRNLLKLQRGKPKFAQITGVKIFHENPKPKNR